MNTRTGTSGCLGIAILVALAITPAHAQDTGGKMDAPPAQTGPATLPEPFETLDQNADGAISKDEAAIDPPLAQAFGTLDKDADGRLSPEEYAAYERGTP